MTKVNKNGENSNLEIFNYNGTDISFQIGNGDVMINLTEVAKAFPEKNLSEIVNSKEITDYVQELSSIENSIFTDYLIVRKGAPHLGGGTWAHRRVALRVAQKLSTRFAIWVDNKIEFLLTHGSVSIQQPQTIDNLIADPANGIKLLQALQTEREEKERAIAEKNIAEQKVIEMLPTMVYAETILNDKINTLLTNQIAKEFGMSDQVLNAILRDLGVQYKQNNQWLLTSKYANKGYTDTRTSSGESKESAWTNVSTVWFQSGRRFIHELIRPLLNEGKLSQIKGSWVLNGKRIKIRQSKTKKMITLW